MKKFLVAILAFVYLAISSGVAINVHYCMGEIASIDLMHSSDTCGKCGMKNNTENGCCKDEFKIVKLEDSHKLITNDINIFAPVALIDNSKSIYEPALEYAQLTSGFNNHSPPISQGTSLCILNSVFRV